MRSISLSLKAAVALGAVGSATAVVELPAAPPVEAAVCTGGVSCTDPGIMDDYVTCHVDANGIKSFAYYPTSIDLYGVGLELMYCKGSRTVWGVARRCSAEFGGQSFNGSTMATRAHERPYEGALVQDTMGRELTYETNGTRCRTLQINDKNVCGFTMAHAYGQWNRTSCY